ncbi:MAG: hypothetical protein Q9164_002548 [Protoblastenia rupestris]
METLSMMAPMVYNPLESFLLLQTLHPFSQEPFFPSFEHVSDSLKRNDLLQENGFIDAKRYDSESLKVHYLRMLKEEVKIEATSRNGSPLKETNPRKRKISSPPLETVDDAAQYTYLLPSLANRLYYQYRDEAVKFIEDEERTYSSLQKEIEAIERDEKDARASRPKSQGVPPISALLRETEDSARPRRPSSPSAAVANGTAHTPLPSDSHVPYPEPRNLHSEIYKTLSQPTATETGPPLLPPPAPSGQGHPLPSPIMDRKSLSQNLGPSPSPRLTQVPLSQNERSSASPIILPPPKGMVRPSSSPSGPLDALADMAGQQYRQNTVITSPQQAHYPLPRQHPPSRHHGQQQYTGYYDAQVYPTSYSTYNQGQVPIYHPHAGNMQPYHAPGQTASHGSPYGVPLYQSPIPSQHPAYYPPQGPYPPPIQTPYSQQNPLYFDSRTPAASASARQRAAKLSPIVTSTSSTKWKKVDAPGLVHSPKSPLRPLSREISPISPVSDKEISSKDEEEPTIKSDSRATGTSQPQTHDGDLKPSATAGKRSKTQGKSRGVGIRRRGGRGGSAGSSTAANSTRRSQSLTDELSIDHLHPSNRIKPEEDSASVASFTADEFSRKSTRSRRENLPNPETDPPRPSTKRKRESNPLSSTPTRKTPYLAPSPSLKSTTPKHPLPTKKPGYVLATRNFSRISLPLLTTITSHRLASLFAKPLTDRDAPGYSTLIYRPQDFKSIRAAINAGSRALTTAIDNLPSPPSANAPHIWVPSTPDLVPPKGIVNAIQLEKELMRIFANAVMFNPDLAENRGIGPAFRTRQRMREGKPADEDPDTAQMDVAEGAKQEIGVAAPVEGAVVVDTRVVAQDAMDAFARWRAVEREGDEAVSGSTPMKLRGGGEGGGEVEGEDDGEEPEEGEEVKESVEQEEEEAEEGVGRRSKRRRR